MTDPEPSSTEREPVKFGTFTGVFTPTLLTILGVIMYVRVGWVVGNAGLLGAFLILGLGILITLCTGLSLSSIATNTRIGPGGPYAIMNRSLGIEVGGAIGIPLYLTRPLGVAMYIIGFREGLIWAYAPLAEYAMPVDLAIFAVLFGIAFKSADLAFKTQYFIMAVIVLSLISIFTSTAPSEATHTVELWGTYPGSPDTNPAFKGADFWMVFAVFFPATTGILAGANMSGDLENPRRAIPRGTLWAIAISTVLYFAVAIWCARAGTLEELSQNYDFIIENSRWPVLVFAGLLGATASSALAGLVGGPRILMAMGENGIIPFSKELSQTTDGEPRAAIVVTGVLTLASIMVRDLNTVAPLVTMFFLITYCTINVVVLLEGSLGLVSYRPTLKVPLIVPLAGLIGCVFSMFIINPTFSLLSVAMVGATYMYMRGVKPDGEGGEDVRSSIFMAVAEWAASRVTAEDMDNVRAWKPHLLVPVEDTENLRGSLPMLLDLARPEGTIKLMGVASREAPESLLPKLERIGKDLRSRGERAFYTMVDIDHYENAVNVGIMALQGAFFRPNLVFSRLPEDDSADARLHSVVQTARQTRVGVVLESLHPKTGLGQQRDIRLWIGPSPDWDPNAAFDTSSLDLVLLMGFRLWRVWNGRLTVTVVAHDRADELAAKAYLDTICDLARLSASVEREVLFGDFDECVKTASAVDLSILGLDADAPNFEGARKLTTDTRGSCLFVLDSGRESARA